MIRLTKLTDYGIALMTHMVRATEAPCVTAGELAGETGLPLPTVSKLMKLLSQGGMVASKRGAAGGYYLARSADEITLADLVETLEGPLGVTECVSGQDCSCALATRCGLKANWAFINRRLVATMSGITLQQMAGNLNSQVVESA